jgi:hypothetical protein
MEGEVFLEVRLQGQVEHLARDLRIGIPIRDVNQPRLADGRDLEVAIEALERAGQRQLVVLGGGAGEHAGGEARLLDDFLAEVLRLEQLDLGVELAFGELLGARRLRAGDAGHHRVRAIALDEQLEAAFVGRPGGEHRRHRPG